MRRGCILGILERVPRGDAHRRSARLFQDDRGRLVSCGPLGVPGVSDVPQDERLLRVVYGTSCAVAAAAKTGVSTDVAR